mmetsp:Transcript_18391/g.28680  ORF Transcript_18391/g.28680 Transcript_18391/m.28680 type:complete len:245 (+) Transcript_18391:1272-2006(+)
MAQAPWLEVQVCKGMRTIPELEAWSPSEAEQLSRPTRRVWKTHAAVQHAPWKGGAQEGIPDGAKVIVVVRNPKDVAVSLYHHSRDLGDIFDFTGDFDTCLREVILPGKVEFGCFWEWYAGWHRVHLLNPDKIMWVAYEDLQEDLFSEIRKVADFCGIDANDEVVQGTCKASSFSTMKAVFAEEDEKKKEKGQFVKKNHIRQGQSGSWSKDMSKEQEVELDRVHHDRCTRFGLKQDLFKFASVRK